MKFSVEDQSFQGSNHATVNSEPKPARRTKSTTPRLSNLTHVSLVVSRRAWIHCQTTDKKRVASYSFAFSAHSGTTS